MAGAASLTTRPGHRPKWRLALEMLDELTAWGHISPVVVGDTGYGNNTTFRPEPANRGLSYVMASSPPHEPEPTDSWLSNLDEHTLIKRLVRLAEIRWRIEHDYRELKTRSAHALL